MPDFNTKCEFKVRESKKAKRVLLKAKPGLRLEVVVPVGFDQSLVPDIVHRNRNWIDRAFESMRAKDMAGPVPVPEKLEFTAVGETWEVNVRLGMDENRLRAGAKMVLVRASGQASAMKLLRWFVVERAKCGLVPVLEELSAATGLEYNRHYVRTQKTRWGSCSSKGNISLNAKLLFLPPDVAEYVIIHELCHTKHLNHSPAFWALVEKFCPVWREMEQRLKSAQVPAWLEVV